MKQASFFVRLAIPKNTPIETREALSRILTEVASRFTFQGLEDWSVDLPDSTKILGAEREFHDLRRSGPMSREMRVYFGLKRDASTFRRLIGSVIGDLKISHPELLAKKDWMKEWRKHYKTQKICAGTRCIFVVPAWKAAPKGKKIVKVQPGQAFGTGTHPTTRLCLQAFLEQMESLPSKARLLDFGAGTGVLALAALALKPSCSAVAVESDPEALDQCRKNARLNRRKLRFLRKISTGKFHFVFANVLAPVLIAHSKALSDRLKPGGLLVVSGILAADSADFLEKFQRPELRLLDGKTEGDWAAYLYRRI